MVPPSTTDWPAGPSGPAECASRFTFAAFITCQTPWRSGICAGARFARGAAVCAEVFVKAAALATAAAQRTARPTRQARMRTVAPMLLRRFRVGRGTAAADLRAKHLPVGQRDLVRIRDL